MDLWKTPAFIDSLKPKKTKRLSPYSETESCFGYSLGLDARPHEITLLKIKHIRLKEKYGEGEIPHQAKTGSGPILLTFSFLNKIS
jgi:hypothetical protein